MVVAIQEHGRIEVATIGTYDFMKTEYKAVVKQDGDWWAGWVEEIPGVNSQGKTRDELMDNLMDNLSSALAEALEMNRESARDAAGDKFEEVTIST